MNATTLIVHGGNMLSGEITPQGSKNEALQIICATLLTQESITLYNVPEIEDVHQLFVLLRLIGHEVVKEQSNTYRFCGARVSVDNLENPEVLEAFTQLRGSLMIAGPLYARFGKAIIARPGGDRIGIRSVSPHVQVFKDLGAKITKYPDYFLITKTKRYRSSIHLKEASVTATANALLATALAAPKKVVIYNAACEPYVQQLCKFLLSLGAPIEGVRSNLLTVHSATALSGGVHHMQPDMIEIGSLMAMAMLIGDGITIKHAFDADLGILPEVFKKIGCRFKRIGQDMYIPKHRKYEIKKPSTSGKPIRVIYDQIWPGLSPDHISCIIVAACQAQGTVIVEQRMFEDRLTFTHTLNRMGASIDLAHSKKAMVIGAGRKKLTGIEMSSPDIRAGMALLIAALSAEGLSTIHNAYQIDRGYENIVQRLEALGARISRRNP